MNVQETAEELTAWLREHAKRAGAKGLVVGLSGGIDSAVVAALCKLAFPNDSLGVLMPCHSASEDLDHGKLLAEAIKLETLTFQLDAVYDNFINMLEGKSPKELGRSLHLANVKPRLRMMTLYSIANKRNYLVVGTGNKSELTVGYFTKYGDGGVDLLPLGGLVKSEVVALAEHLGVPKPIITKPPSAGLWENQTDESEMGIAYKDLDDYVLAAHEGREPANREAASKIKEMNRRSEHKRALPPIFPVNRK